MQLEQGSEARATWVVISLVIKHPPGKDNFHRIFKSLMLEQLIGREALHHHLKSNS